MRWAVHRRVLLWALALIVGLVPLLLPHAAQAGLPAQEYLYAECSRADAAAIQAEIETMALAPLIAGGSGLDVDTLVARHWSDLGAGAVFDQEVDAAIVRLQANTDYWTRFLSGWSSQHAEALANQVAADAFNSPVFQTKLDELATALAAGLVAEMDASAARSASSALLCLQSFVGERYSATLFDAFAQRIGQDLAPAVGVEASAPVAIAPVDLHLKALTGVGVIIAAQISRRIAVSLSQKIAGRLAGRIAGRVLGRIGTSVIPYIGWVVGAGLIVWDLVEGSQGALPQIREALQAETVKQEMRAEIAAAVREGLQAETQTLAATLAGTLVGEWQQYCADHDDLCTLAAEGDDFRGLLDATPVDRLDRLAALVSLFLADLGRPQLDAALADGTLAELLALPPEADAVLAATGSPQTVLAWATLAGPDFARMVELELYRELAPEQLTPAAFATLVAFADHATMHKLLALPPARWQILARLPSAELESIVAATPSDDLVWLAAYLAGQTPAAAEALAAQLAAGAVTVAALQAPPTAVPVVGAAAPAQQLGGMTRSGPSAAEAAQSASRPAEDPATAVRPAGPAPRGVWIALVLALCAALLVVAGSVAMTRRRNSAGMPG
jgi:hypothetical protein